MKSIAAALFCAAAVVFMDCSAEGVSTLVPLNDSVFRLVEPDGTEKAFLRSAADPHVLDGEAPWVGEIDGRQALVRTEEGYAGEAVGYMFVDGWLRRALRGTADREVPVPSRVGLAGTYQSLWQEKRTLLRFVMPQDIWQGGSRLRLWFTNPNDAGVLFAELSLALLLLAYTSWGRCRVITIGAALASCLAVPCLFLTGSRGGLVSFLAGFSALAVALFRRRLRIKTLLIAVVLIAALVAVPIMMGIGERYTTGLLRTTGDESNQTRMEMLVNAPKMFALAPQGWGLGQSGRAYVDWFQKRTDQLCVNMVSSHLTMLVELGWWKGVVYLFVWCFGLLFCFFTAFRGQNPIPAALWCALGVSGLVNPTLFRWEAYVLPVLATAVVYCRGVALSRRSLVWLSSVSLALAGGVCLGLLFSVQGTADRSKFAFRDDLVTFNAPAPDTVIVDDDFAMHGGYWWFAGKEIRTWFAKHPDVSCGYTRTLSGVPRNVRRLVLVGRQAEAFVAQRKAGGGSYGKLEEIILLSPSLDPALFPVDLLAQYKVRAYLGALAAIRLGAMPPPWVTVVRGMELYLPLWLTYATEKRKI